MVANEFCERDVQAEGDGDAYDHVNVASLLLGTNGRSVQSWSKKGEGLLTSRLPQLRYCIHTQLYILPTFWTALRIRVVVCVHQVLLHELETLFEQLIV